jgi:hypothetical protein
MKKRFHIPISQGLLLLALVATAALFSSFTIALKSANVHSLSHDAMAAIQNYSFHKLNFWQKTALAVGAFGASSFVVRRFRRHYGADLGCLGVLGAIVLGVIIIALLPVILVVGLIMLIFGIPIRWGWRGYRNYGHGGRHERRRHHRR